MKKSALKTELGIEYLYELIENVEIRDKCEVCKRNLGILKREIEAERTRKGWR